MFTGLCGRPLARKMPAAKRLKISIERLNHIIDNAIFEYKHNIIIIWGELGDGKTSLMLQMIYRKVQDWRKVVSFVLEPHVCMKCGEEWDAEQPFVFEVPCRKCSKETKTTDIGKAIAAAMERQLVKPFPLDMRTGIPRKFPFNTTFTINTVKAQGKITRTFPYLNFTFYEVRDTIKQCVDTRIRLPIMGWDDPAVYFHRSNIQYMHPDIKTFFSRYNFIRQYVANLVMAVPSFDFVPEQLSFFCTADVMLKDRGVGDFDVKRTVRSFFGKKQSWRKSYDGRDVTWPIVPEEWFTAYEEIRHAHAIEAFEHPEEIFVTTMPKSGKEFTEEESLFE